MTADLVPMSLNGTAFFNEKLNGCILKADRLFTANGSGPTGQSAVGCNDFVDVLSSGMELAFRGRKPVFRVSDYNVDHPDNS